MIIIVDIKSITSPVLQTPDYVAYHDYVRCSCVTLSRVNFFFFSSRRRHTRCSRDWSSDVCSSDLPSLPNYLAMITGDWIGTDVLGTGHTYPKGSRVGISDDDSPSVATDYGPPANPSFHRWTVQLPSVAGQLVKAGKDWRAGLQKNPVSGAGVAHLIGKAAWRGRGE